ncbi:unnamed protein product, partial [Adineta ricciae]
MPFVYRLATGPSLSVQQLQHALQLIIFKHLSLRTALRLDAEINSLTQIVMDLSESTDDKLYTFIESTYETNEQLDSITRNEKANPGLFDLAQGLVFRCHLVYHQQ